MHFPRRTIQTRVAIDRNYRSADLQALDKFSADTTATTVARYRATDENALSWTTTKIARRVRACPKNLVVAVNGAEIQVARPEADEYKRVSTFLVPDPLNPGGSDESRSEVDPRQSTKIHTRGRAEILSLPLFPCAALQRTSMRRRLFRRNDY